MFDLSYALFTMVGFTAGCMVLFSIQTMRDKTAMNVYFKPRNSKPNC